ncbi:MAG TPA: PqqD family protein [Clostridia bacterium]|nr:PqqD family protein [Clostridia bacterium]HRX43186.1 PqqD family protein [Clostridia bacterium]
MKLNENIILKDMQGEAVLLNLDTGDYYSLNAVGNKIINLTLEDMTVDEIAAELIEIYDIDEKTAKSDINSLINDLINNNILEI